MEALEEALAGSEPEGLEGDQTSEEGKVVCHASVDAAWRDRLDANGCQGCERVAEVEEAEAPVDGRAVAVVEEELAATQLVAGAAGCAEVVGAAAEDEIPTEALVVPERLQTGSCVG